jgi:hypothetical protein
MESHPCHITIKQMHGLIEMLPFIGSTECYGLGTLNSMAMCTVYCCLTTALLTSTSILTSFLKSFFFSSFPQIALHFFNPQTCLKVGYNAEMLRCLLAICYEPALYEEAVAAGARA